MSEKPPKPSNPAPAPRAARRHPARPARTCRSGSAARGSDRTWYASLISLKRSCAAGSGVDVRVPLLGELAEGALDVGVERGRSTPRTT